MKMFPYGHAAHPDWRMAAGLVLAQLRAQMSLRGFASQPTLALLYITDHYEKHAQDILDHLSGELPEVTDWAGTAALGIVANNVEYTDEPAMAVMLCELPSDQYRVFSGVAPLGLGFDPYTALVHADAHIPDLDELVGEMAQRTQANYIFGGLSSSRGKMVQFAFGADGTLKGHGATRGVLSGGMSGVAFGSDVHVVSRVTQGCMSVSPRYEITEADNNVVTKLDGKPALDVMLRDLNLTLDQPEQALLAVRSTLVGLTRSEEAHMTVLGATAPSPLESRTGRLGADVLIRHIVGLDPTRRGVVVGSEVQPGMQLAFCRRDAHTARTDLMRMCAEIREELEPAELPVSAVMALTASEHEAAPHPSRGIAGAVYVSCTGRGGAHFGGPGAELQIVRRALGNVPLVGFFAAGEIARNHLYGYTGVLTVFTTQL